MGSVTPAARSRPSRRFLRCFTSDIEDGDTRSQRSRVADYVAAGEKEGIVFPNVLPVLKPARENDVGAAGRRRKEGSNSFARIMRAVVFETALAKKMRKKKKRQKSYRPAMIGGEEQSKTTPYTMKKSASESELRGGFSLSETLSGSSPPFNNESRSAMSSSSQVSSSRSSPARNRTFNSKPLDHKPPPTRKPQPKSKFGTRYTIIGLFSFIFSLIAVIFWGKACAIFFTSACLFVVPRLSPPRSSFSPPGSAPVPAEISADEQKKKVAVDGNKRRGR